jgi:ATP-dependent DNA helicase DinG
MEFFWDCVKRRRRAARAAAAAKENGEVVSTRQKGLFRPKIVLTPARDDPSFQVVPARGQRIISRLWWRGETKEGAADRSERPIKANAVLFTSATLGYPGRSGWESFKAMTWTLGIDEWDEHLINQDLCATLEPRKFGEAKFIFAHPSAPLPTGDDGEGGLSLESARYAAAAIAHVAYTPNPKRRKKSCRILVLTKNTVDPQKIHDRLPEDLKLRCIVRRKGDGLREGAKRFKEASDAIFIAYGAWEGLDLPGLVDYLVVTRLPFNPPPGDDDETNAEFGGNLLAMLRTLRQGLGRAIRNWNDSTTYVFTDPRIGLPEAVYVNEDVVPHEKSSPRYLRAVPVRFRKSMDAGTLLPEPAPAPRGRARRAAEPLEA